MADKTLAIDIQDQTVRPTNPINIAIINKPNVVKGYNATFDQIKYLIQLSRYWIFEAGTRIPVTAENIYNYFPEYNPYGGATQEEIDKLNQEIQDLVERVDEIDVSKLSVTEYEKNTEYPRGRIVYVTPGQLYQANQDFTSNNDPDKTLEQAFNYDIQQGYLSPVTDAEVGDLESRVNVLEQKIINAEEVEFYNTYAEFPETGVVDIIYVDNSDGKTYTWDPVFEEYNAMNTNNIIDGSVIQSTI
jgi:hypothetical protein